MRVGIIGTQWGRMHIGAFRAAGGEVVALCGRDSEKTRALAATDGIALATTDARVLCEAADVVVVASPDALHFEHGRLALEAGKQVLCEKPLAASEAEARELERLTAGRRAAVSFPYRQLPPLRALKGWLQQNGPVLAL